MAILMSVAFALPVYYLCQMQGSFFVFWLAWLISLADGIGESQAALSTSCLPSCLLVCSLIMHDDRCSTYKVALFKVVICLFTCAAFAYGTAAVSPNMDIANCVLLTYPTALLFAGGYVLRWADIPRYWIW